MAASASPLVLPRLVHPDPLLVAWADQISRALQIELQRIAAPAGQTGYALTGVAASRTLNPTTATTAQAAQVLATVVQDLQTKGFLA